jgi:hypothetical protein
MIAYEHAVLELSNPGVIGNQKKRRILELLRSIKAENDHLMEKLRDQDRARLENERGPER